MFSRKILFLILIYKPDRIGFTQLFVMCEGLEYFPLYWSGPRELCGRCPGLDGLQVPRHAVMLVLEEIPVTVSRLKMMELHPRLDGKAGEGQRGEWPLATCCQSGTYSLEEPLGVEKKLSPSICASGCRGNVLVWAQSSFLLSGAFLFRGTKNPALHPHWLGGMWEGRAAQAEAVLNYFANMLGSPKLHILFVPGTLSLDV